MSKDEDYHSFDDFRATESLKILEQAISTWNLEAIKNPLYYVNFFQYRHGDLYRAILGRDVIYDREWEVKYIKILDEVLSKKEHEAKVVVYQGQRQIAMRGVFWRWNSWRHREDIRNRGNTYCTMMLEPDQKKVFYTRRVNDLIDIEGDIEVGHGVKKNGVLTLRYATWKIRYESLFKEVRLEGSNERSTYQSQSSPWYTFVDETWSRHSKEEQREHLDQAAAHLSTMSKRDRTETFKETAKSLLALSPYVRRRMVSKPWRVLKNIRGPAVDE